MESFLKNTLIKAEKRLKSEANDIYTSGACVLLVFINKNTIYSCNIGNCRAVLYRHS